MTAEDFGKLAMAIKTYYPRDNMLPTKESMQLWYDALKDIDYQSACIGLKNHVVTSKFPPTIADIRSGVAITQPQELNEMEAWALVSKAIRKSSYHSVEEYEKLPPTVQKAVGLPDQLRIWAVDENYVESVIMSQFQKCYREEIRKQEEFQKIPSDIKQLIENGSKGSQKAQIQKKRDDAIKLLLDRNNSLEIKIEGVEMPEKARRRFDELFN